MHESYIKSLWGSDECHWSAVDSEGQSGGIVTIWRKGVMRADFSFKAKGLLGVNVVWNGTNCYFINVYSPCTIAEKRALWSQLLVWKNNLSSGEWIIGGDFNAIKTEDERIGRGMENRTEMEEFAGLIDLLEVVDLPVIGNKFTWLKLGGDVRSRIDRFLMTEGIINLWKAVAQASGNRDISDNRPIWVKTCNKDWGVKPFKVFSCWNEHPDLERFVGEAWKAFQCNGTSVYVLKEKIKHIRDRLRWWNLLKE
ncbi:uncharacterized protein LOC131613233 [Vicia villosa]|uniref:uncharacterized protein LOC131613233 n=1 Tax=Vicia villosa TaxID=3911 RepID=UPI00273B8349|nr:uncharacterized protein LOC131613233 [Vicia villosa]